INDVNKWIQNSLKTEDKELEIIVYDNLVPVFTQLEQHNLIERVYGLKGKQILFFEKTSIDYDLESYQVSFPIMFYSNEYNLVGRIIHNNNEVLYDKGHIKIINLTKQGFQFTTNGSKNINLVFEWYVVRIPADVGIFTKEARKLNIKQISNEFNYEDPLCEVDEKIVT
ncbi:12729_t:CDS:1, partial [Racocetra fulgida]